MHCTSEVYCVAVEWFREVQSICDFAPLFTCPCLEIGEVASSHAMNWEILRPPGDSGHPPVVLRRGIQYRATLWPDGRKIQGPETPAKQAGDSGQEKPATKKLGPFLLFLVNDARGRNNVNYPAKLSIMLGNH